MIELADRLQYYCNIAALVQCFTKLDGKFCPWLGERPCEQNVDRNADDLDILHLGKCCHLLARYAGHATYYDEHTPRCKPLSGRRCSCTREPHCPRKMIGKSRRASPYCFTAEHARGSGNRSQVSIGLSIADQDVGVRREIINRVLKRINT